MSATKEWYMQLQESVCLICNKTTEENSLYCGQRCASNSEYQFEQQLEIGEYYEVVDSGSFINF